MKSVSWFLCCLCKLVVAQSVYEINASPFSTAGAPLPRQNTTYHEKVIMVYPKTHLWGAYGNHGQLIRWGIATAGANHCPETQQICHTHVGVFRIYALGDESCYSYKYNGAMPYCMYFHGGEALHGSAGIVFDNKSHGCVRVHVNDAKWLRYHFVEKPSHLNHYRGTLIVINAY